MKEKNTKNIFALILIFLVISILTAHAEGSVDAVGQQYLEMLQNYYDQIQEAEDNIEKNRKYLWINHEYVMKLRATARQYDSRGNQKNIDEAHAESDQYSKDIDRLKLQIKDLQQEQRKLKMDAFKYYKGLLPQPFKVKWDKIVKDALQSEQPDYSSPPWSENNEKIKME